MLINPILERSVGPSVSLSRAQKVENDKIITVPSKLSNMYAMAASLFYFTFFLVAWYSVKTYLHRGRNGGDIVLIPCSTIDLRLTLPNGNCFIIFRCVLASL